MMSAEVKAAWLAERCGCLTASNMWKAMAFLRNGEPAKERTRYMHELIAERETGFSVRNVVTPAMERGLAYEDEMFDMFVELTGRDARPSRLYEHPAIPLFKATPDRELDDGLMEGKIPSIEKFIAWKLAGIVPVEHHPQLLAQLACSGKKWTGFIAYCPEIKDERRRLFLAKFVPTQEQITVVEDAARTFLNEVEDMFSAFVTA